MGAGFTGVKALSFLSSFVCILLCHTVIKTETRASSYVLVLLLLLTSYPYMVTFCNHVHLSIKKFVGGADNEISAIIFAAHIIAGQFSAV